MTTFHYIAIDNKGKLQKGTIEATTAKDARQLLRRKNVIPTKLYPFENKPISFSLKHFSPKIFLTRHSLSNKELTLITRQLATLFSAGLPISDVLTAVSEQSAHPRAKSILLAIRTKVQEGHSLASSLREHSQVFSPLYCGIVAAGEKSGNLAQVLQSLANYTEQQHKLKQKMVYALIYPAVLIFVSLSIIIFLLEYVVPKMVSVYSHINQALPLLTRILIAWSDSIKSGGMYIFILLIAAIVGFRVALNKNLAFREKFHNVLLRTPLLGKTIQTINTARYARTLAMLCSSGIPILEGMTTTSQLITNIPIRQAVEEATQHVREGAAIHLALKQTTFFSPMSIHLIASGEASGQLEALLEHTATQQEDEITRIMDTLLTLFEPILILVMGGIVLFIVLAVLLPIFELNQLTF